MDCDGGFVAAS